MPVFWRCSGGRGADQHGQVDPTEEGGCGFHAGYAAQQSGDLELARAKFAEVVKLAPEIAEAHEALGAVLVGIEQSGRGDSGAGGGGEVEAGRGRERSKSCARLCCGRRSGEGNSAL